MITFLQRVLAFAPVLFVAACVTAAPHTLSPDNIHDLKIVDVEITGVEVIRSWPEGEEHYARSPGADPAIVPRACRQRSSVTFRRFRLSLLVS